MKLLSILGASFAMIQSGMAGESALTTTWHPLDGLGSGKIQIVPVACHHWYAHGGSTAVGLMNLVNVPPTDNPKEATEDLNLASVCKVRFSTSDLGDPRAPLEVKMDVTGFAVPRRHDHPREDVIRACIECLRRCLPEKLSKTPLTVKGADGDREWIGAIVKEFNGHDRSKVFFMPET
ncbi:hypothetical protein OKA05_27380 [Luteolibacter arcticus]|uniref:Uncharacterized protein n=1 Tax=Luteolibacter arcticus TaxID=1581411 RepID=A0ABT3GRZ9_9BACT|nr:hypothetical protein [Luteolibacter arcticus]MCW1926307.1 hypothetical protein [Luteolibacter arcticus]